jgi:predicted phage terminase large subunit-like protein
MNDAKYIKGQKRNMKVWNAQFQQKPSPPGGFIFNPDKWNFYDVVSTTEKKVALPDPDFQILSVDCAWKSGQENDKVALVVIGVEGPRKYLLDYQHEHMSYVGILDAIRAMRKKYPKISFVLVEKAANGEAVIKQLSEEMGGMVGVVAKDDKEARAHAASADLDSGQCFIPNPEQESRYQTDIIDEFAHFNGDGTIEFDDLVDAFTQAINWLREKFWSSEHLDKAYKEVTEGKNLDPQVGEACPGCGKTGTIVREGTSWVCKSCKSSGHGARRRIVKQGM